METQLLTNYGSVKAELAQHVIDKIDEGILTNENRDDWHYYAFGDDYYLIGYFNCSEWLKKHNVGELEAVGICQRYEIDNFGKARVYENMEQVVNMLAYIFGEDLIYSGQFESVEELREEMQRFIN